MPELLRLARRWHSLPADQERYVARVESLEGPQSAADYQAIHPLLIGTPAAWAMQWASRKEAPAEKAALLRCLFGNPWLPVKLKWLKGRLCKFVSVTETPEPLAKLPSRLRRHVASSTRVVETWRAVPWLTPAVLAIARSIYEGRSTDTNAGRVEWGVTDLPILWDALSEAGCQSEALRLHCLETVRAKGCWALDLLLGLS